MTENYQQETECTKGYEWGWDEGTDGAVLVCVAHGHRPADGRAYSVDVPPRELRFPCKAVVD